MHKTSACTMVHPLLITSGCEQVCLLEIRVSCAARVSRAVSCVKH